MRYTRIREKGRSESLPNKASSPGCENIEIISPDRSHRDGSVPSMQSRKAGQLHELSVSTNGNIVHIILASRFFVE